VCACVDDIQSISTKGTIGTYTEEPFPFGTQFNVTCFARPKDVQQILEHFLRNIDSSSPPSIFASRSGLYLGLYMISLSLIGSASNDEYIISIQQKAYDPCASHRQSHPTIHYRQSIATM
jgi:hypothetical protein